MDLIKILRSFEEFVFEAISWLVFYPLTLWRIVRRPLATMAYSEREQADPEEQRYDDALSPPLLLLATVLLANLIGAAAHVPPLPGSTEVMKALNGSPQNLVLFRSLVFSLVPLVAAATLLRRKGITLSRDTLRAPFYAQCYLAAPCAVFVSAGGIILQRRDLPDIIGVLGIAAGTLWFIVVQARWFRAQLSASWLNATVTAVWATVRALAYLSAVLLLIALI